VTDAQPLALQWKERLGLASRHAPEFFETSDAVVDTPHALAIRAALDDLGLSGVLCVQGVPTIAILNVAQYDAARVVDIHGALWNQGLASLLLVAAGGTLRAFSLARKPQKEWDHEFEQRCLIATLEATADALEIGNLIYGAESGRLWKEHAEYFDAKERIDEVLLENLNASHQALCKTNLSSDAAQALLIQAMFIAYLEDREIITEQYFQVASRKKAGSFSALLETKDVRLLGSLFATLRDDFNGDLFVAPCSFESSSKAPTVVEEHLDVLARFRSGREEMGRGGQYRFWGYNFRYIPIELVSAVYDRFLGEREEERKEQGAYYTPMFLADTVVSQVWDLLSPSIKERGQFLDPACGSGVFLVRSFQRLCEHWRATHRSRTIRWDSLLTILRRIHGWDLNGSAVRVAVFSLYVALLEEVSPPDIRVLIKRGKLLPDLWDKNLACRDFFVDPEHQTSLFDVIIGNPPWTSRRGPNRASLRWSKKNKLPMPSGEDAWAFVWKALRQLRPDGLVAFLLPAMGFLHNHAAVSLAARRRLIRESLIRRVINFADLRFQLFDGAIRPAALMVFERSRSPAIPYRFDYWAPKADLNLQLKRMITLSSADKLSLSSTAVEQDGLAFKHRLWMREPDAKLFSYLSKLPTLGALIKNFGGLKRRRVAVDQQWVIGQGYQPFHGSDDGQSSSPYSMSKFVGKLPDLPIAAFQRLAQPTANLTPSRSSRVRRKGFEAGFSGPRILIPRGVETAHMRLRAAYTEEALTFQHIIQAITIPSGDEDRGKLLAALLNSRVAIWFAFHGTASFGSERPEVQQAELLNLPFPAIADLPEPDKAKDAAMKLVTLIDQEIQNAAGPFKLGEESRAVLSEIDRLAYQYFCLSADETIIIEDTVERIIPAVQPHQGSYPDLWKCPNTQERRDYAATLVSSVDRWLLSGTSICASLEAMNADLGVLRLTVDGSKSGAGYAEENEHLLRDVLSRISRHIHKPLDGNFQLLPDLRIFVGKSLYLVKPMQRRFWLRSTALADADAIAMDLQASIDIERRRSRA
jgi:type I restriction-modification system DNA methylase subunit